MTNDLEKRPQNDEERFFELIGRAGKLTAKERAELDVFLARNKDLWRKVDAGIIAARRLVERECGEDSPAVKIVMDGNYDGMRRALARPTDGPLERALADHVALCWLRLQLVEQKHAGVMAQEHSFRSGDYWERRLSACQRRYLRAVETLARVRRLALPVLQVNIADKQVNLAAGSPPAPGPLEQLPSPPA